MSNTLKMIGISGKKFSGKDTVGDFFKAMIPSIHHLAFATPMKQILMDHFGFSREALYDPEKKENWNEYWGMTNRDAMKNLGDGLRRTLHPDVWLKAMEIKMKNNPDDIWLCTDIRYNNEAEMVKRNNGIIIEVINPKLANNDTHISEAGIDKGYVDFFIVNDGTYEYLYEAVYKIVWKIIQTQIPKEKQISEDEQDVMWNRLETDVLTNKEAALFDTICKLHLA